MTQSNTTINSTDIATNENKTLMDRHQQLRDGCSIVGYEIRNWSGKKTFKEGKVTTTNKAGLKIDVPDDLVSPGRKSLLDTKTHLSFCNRFSSRMARLYSRYGVKFLGNYLVSDSCLDELLKQSENFLNEYNVEVDNFCSKYENLIAEWCTEHPGLESVIRDDYMTVDEVRSRFRLKLYKPIRFSTRVEAELSELVGEAAAQMFEEIAKEAEFLINTSLTIKDGAAKGSLKQECTQDIKRPIRRLRDKVFSLYMLDPVFEGVVDVFDELLEQALPDTGKIKGAQFRNLMAHIMMMTDPKKLKLHAQGVNQIAAKVASVIHAEEMPSDPKIVISDNSDTPDSGDMAIEDEEAVLLARLREIQANKSSNQSLPEVEQQADTPETIQEPVVSEEDTEVVEVSEQPRNTEEMEMQQETAAEEIYSDVAELTIELERSVDLDEPIAIDNEVEFPTTSNGFWF